MKDCNLRCHPLQQGIHHLSRLILTLCLVSLLSACSADLEDYQGTTPTFDLFGYFSGETHAWGMVQDYRNQQTRRFEVSLIGTIEGDVLTLDEKFLYDDGERDTRVWTITRLPNGRYQGQAGDILGTAEGREVGNALRWRYDFQLTYGDQQQKQTIVHFDDWLYRQDDQHVMNISYISKWGVTVGKVTIFFQK